MKTLVLISIAALALTGGAVAQTTTVKPMTPPAAKPATATTTAATGRKPMTAASKACSTQADAKGLHGKDREKFRRACLKG